MIIPSIDIMNGKAVQLKQGIEKIYENENIEEVLEQYKIFPQINVIDLNSAMGNGDNKDIIKKICKKIKCNVGGGIRNVEIAKEYLNAGANSIIVGTMANEDFLKQLPKEKVIVALDTKNGKIATHGWKELKAENIYEKMLELENYCYKFLITNVNVEGLNEGTDLNFWSKLVGKTKNDIMVAGGITTLEEIKYIHKLGFDQVLGMAITSGKLNIIDCYIEIMDFEKQNGLIPTIVQEIDTKEVLMLAYSSKESLKKTYEIGKATYYSRSRKSLWTKGEKSSNIQNIEKIYLDCDSDTILFLVKQKGNACHRNKRTCFEI
jgi:phosphoribosylformimino-5-aminoimidazole carboxamide ribonucleotide (ProFAR) isomerase